MSSRPCAKENLLSDGRSERRAKLTDLLLPALVAAPRPSWIERKREELLPSTGCLEDRVGNAPLWLRLRYGRQEAADLGELGLGDRRLEPAAKVTAATLAARAVFFLHKTDDERTAHPAH